MTSRRTTSKPYIVRFSENLYFCAIDSSGEVIGTPFPSFAARFSYLVGAEIAAALREKGYADAVVTNLFGQPVIPEDEVIPDIRDTEDFKKAWSPDPAKVAQ